MTVSSERAGYGEARVPGGRPAASSLANVAPADNRAPRDPLTTAATPGHAMKAAPVLVEGVPLYPTGAILGKALEPLAEGAGSIRVLLLR